MNKNKKKFRITDWLLEVILLLLIVFFSFTATNFFTISNFFNVLRNISFKGIIACFMTWVIISGEIDLSVGSLVAFAATFNSYVNKSLSTGGMSAEASIFIAMLCTLLATAVIGVVVSMFVTRLGIPSFIVTLAFMQLGKGAAFLITNGFPIQGYPSWFKTLGNGRIGDVPIPLIIFAVFLVFSWYILSYTPFGRSIYIIGSNQEAAVLNGINVVRVKTIIFMCTSISAGLAGILVSSQMNSGSPGVGSSYEMDVISAVIIGGASLNGGSGKLRGTLVGSIFIGVIINALTLMGISDYWQYIVRGSLVLFAVFLNVVVKKRLREKGF